MTPDSLFWIVVGGLFVTCFASIGARSLREFSRHELELICRRRDARDFFGEILRTHARVAQGAESLVALAASVVLVAGMFWLIHPGGDGTPPLVDLAASPAWALLGTVVGWGLLLSIAKLWLPWAIVSLWAEPFLFHTWRMWKFVGLLMSPALWCAKSVDFILHRLAGRTQEEPNGETFEEEIRAIVTEGHREGLLEEDAREMIEGVIELGDADVSEIMTPRTDMHMLQVDLPWDEMIKYVIEIGHTRIPVYNHNRDDVIGVLYSKDLLPDLASKPGTPRRPVREILRKAHFVPESKAVDDLLEEFQQTHNHLAIVLDEYGGVSGLVTIEDVLEEIVGEIVDEYDKDHIEEIEKLDEKTCEALGRAHVDEINETLGLALPEDEDFDTIGGFVFSELGRIPSTGESLQWQDQVQITVLEVTHRRIEKVRIERLDDTAQRESA